MAARTKSLHVLSQIESATVKELQEKGQFDLAYNTLMTTLDRLYKKNVLDRVREGKAFRYSSRYSKGQLQWESACGAIEELIGGDPPFLPLSYLVDALVSHDRHALDELERIVELKRRELGKADDGK